jgi:hypothetical protein
VSSTSYRYSSHVPLPYFYPQRFNPCLASQCVRGVPCVAILCSHMPALTVFQPRAHQQYCFSETIRLHPSLHCRSKLHSLHTWAALTDSNVRVVVWDAIPDLYSCHSRTLSRSTQCAACIPAYARTGTCLPSGQRGCTSHGSGLICLVQTVPFVTGVRGYWSQRFVWHVPTRTRCSSPEPASPPLCSLLHCVRSRYVFRIYCRERHLIDVPAASQPSSTQAVAKTPFRT